MPRYKPEQIVTLLQRIERGIPTSLIASVLDQRTNGTSLTMSVLSNTLWFLSFAS
jgi:hypothetical protein